MNLFFSTPKNQNFFFGYYGKSQLNKTNTKLLCLKTTFINKLPEENDFVEIGYFDLCSNKKNFFHIAYSKTFNWQQGCMLQWLGPDFKDNIIYNDIIENKFCSVIINILTKKKRILPFPIYDVNSMGTQAICIDHERHFFCRRGYSYAGVKNNSKNIKVVHNDGIWLLDIQSKKYHQIINIENLLKFRPLSNMNNATHYVEHLMFNPEGNRFCFLHRWKMPEGGIYSRLYTAKTDGSELYLLLDSGRMGHFCWKSKFEILAYAGVPNQLNKLRKNKNLVKFLFKPFLPIFHVLFKDNSAISKLATGDSYIILTDKSEKIKKVASKLKFEDGHPSFFPQNKNVFVTDIYPKKNNKHEAKLMMFNLQTNTLQLIDIIKSNELYNETALRCDLHPKISFDGSFVSIDTLQKNHRGVNLYKIDLNSI